MIALLVIPITIVALSATPHRTPVARPPVLTQSIAPSVEQDLATAIVVRGKPEWTNDQGFKLSPTRVAYKRRF